MHLVWYKRDLRITDHGPLAEAASHSPVAALYVVELEYWSLPDTSGRQWEFISECLVELAQDLKNLKIPLVVRVGDVVNVLSQLHQNHPIKTLYTHEETGNLWTYERDKRVHSWSRSNNIPWIQHQQFGVTRGSKNRDIWGQRWDALMAQPLIKIPSATTVPLAISSEEIPKARELGLSPDPCPGRQRGGRSPAVRSLKNFLQVRGHLYPQNMSSPNLAYTGCSRLSPYLATGVVSMREVAQATKARMVDVRRSKSKRNGNWSPALRAFWSRLHWHCHFIQKLEDEPKIQEHNLHSAYDGIRSAHGRNSMFFIAWSSGQTGFPFLDACLRALNYTGWINFRMRAMITAFASYHLWLDWRETGLYLARQFTDYEPGIHWNQIQMQSGTTGINAVRIYNPVKQGYDHDPTGKFIRRWVPELGNIKTAYIHEPWKMAKEEQKASGSLIGSSYPERIIDHKDAAREALRRIYSIRNDAGFKEKSAQILVKHGSRKATLSKARKRRNRTIVNPAQGILDF